MKKKLDLLVEGCRDGLNGWVDEKRKQTDSAYRAGVAIGVFRYQQFLAGPKNPPRGYTYPEPPMELYKPLLEALAENPEDRADVRKLKRSGSKLMQLEKLNESELQKAPSAAWPFSPSHESQPMHGIRHVALC